MKFATSNTINFLNLINISRLVGGREFYEGFYRFALGCWGFETSIAFTNSIDILFTLRGKVSIFFLLLVFNYNWLICVLRGAHALSYPKNVLFNIFHK
jgi:hypothetical protein